MATVARKGGHHWPSRFRWIVGKAQNLDFDEGVSFIEKFVSEKVAWGWEGLEIPGDANHHGPELEWKKTGCSGTPNYWHVNQSSCHFIQEGNKDLKDFCGARGPILFSLFCDCAGAPGRATGPKEAGLREWWGVFPETVGWLECLSDFEVNTYKDELSIALEGNTNGVQTCCQFCCTCGGRKRSEMSLTTRFLRALRFASETILSTHRFISSWTMPRISLADGDSGDRLNLCLMPAWHSLIAYMQLMTSYDFWFVLCCAYTA